MPLYIVDPRRVSRYGFLTPNFTDAQRAALREASAVTPARILRAVGGQAALPRWSPPFRSWNEYVSFQRWRWDQRNAITPEQVREQLIREANTHGDQIAIDLVALTQQERWDSRARDMILYGVALGLTCMAAGLAIGVAIGGVAGPYGAAAGAVIGVCVGVVMGTIPFGRYDLRSQWSSVLDAQLPVERYASLSQARRLCDVARASNKLGSLGAWRWAPDAFLTIYGDTQQAVEWLIQDTLLRDCFPRPSMNRDTAFRWGSEGSTFGAELGYQVIPRVESMVPAALAAFATLDPVAKYAFGIIAGHNDDHKRLAECDAWGPFIAGRGSQWLRPALQRFSPLKCGEIRKALIAGPPALGDCEDLPITGDIVYEVNEYNRAHRAGAR